MNSNSLINLFVSFFKAFLLVFFFSFVVLEFKDAHAASVLNGVTLNTEANFDKNEVQAFLSRHYGKEISVKLLRQVLDEVDHYFHEHGYPSSKAYFPEQQSDNGMLEITVLSPFLEGIQFKNRAQVNIQTRRRLFSEVSAMQDHVVNNDEMLGALLRLQDLGAFRTYGRYVQGQSREDATVLLLSMRPMQQKYPFTLFANNHGTKASGQYRLGVSGEVVNLSGYADNLNYFFAASNEKQLDTGVTYRIPLNSHPTVAGVGFNAGSYSLAKEYEDLGAKGYAAGGEAYIEEPILRRENYALKLRFGGNLKYLEDRFESFDVKFKKRQTSLFGETTGFYRKDLFSFSGRVALTYGKNTELDDYEINPDDKFALFNAESSFAYKVADSSVVNLDLALQKANKALDGSLRFSAGGEGRVSSFTSSEGSADEGIFASIAFNQGINEHFNIAPHFDIARISNKNGDAATIKGAGVKLDFQADGFFVKGDLATSLGSIRGEDKARMLLSFGYTLS